MSPKGARTALPLRVPPASRRHIQPWQHTPSPPENICRKFTICVARSRMNGADLGSIFQGPALASSVGVPLGERKGGHRGMRHCTNSVSRHVRDCRTQVEPRHARRDVRHRQPPTRRKTSCGCSINSPRCAPIPATRPAWAAIACCRSQRPDTPDHRTSPARAARARDAHPLDRISFRAVRRRPRSRCACRSGQLPLHEPRSRSPSNRRWRVWDMCRTPRMMTEREFCFRRHRAAGAYHRHARRAEEKSWPAYRRSQRRRWSRCATCRP